MGLQQSRFEEGNRPTASPMSDEPSSTAAYFERVDEHRYLPTEHAGGAWSPGEIHFSPLGGLIVHAIERYLAEHQVTGMLLSRITFDILGFLASEECDIRVETVRPGRTIQLIEATVTIDRRTAVRARAWFLSPFNTSVVAGGGPDPLPSPDGVASWPMTSVWFGGYVASLDARALIPPQPGRARVWLSTDVALVAGEAAGPLASWIKLVDTANGIAVRQPPGKEWMFPNVDLSIHLHRQPEGRWTGLDTTVTFGAAGLGVTSTVLHDLKGPVGYATQALTVRPVLSSD